VNSRTLSLIHHVDIVATQATSQFLYYTNGSTSLVGVCDPIGPAPAYNFTGICANDTLPIGELADVSSWFVLQDSLLLNLVFVTFLSRWCQATQ
jgi:hypothetical protein